MGEYDQSDRKTGSGEHGEARKRLFYLYSAFHTQRQLNVLHMVAKKKNTVKRGKNKSETRSPMKVKHFQ